jgi:CheY-like chemotaxis protein
MDGYEVAAKLRQLPQSAAALLIALTGYGQENDKRRAQTAGFDVHLVKPADPGALADLIESHRQTRGTMEAGALTAGGRE